LQGRVSDEVIQTSTAVLDCFAEPVIGPRSRDPLARNDAGRTDSEADEKYMSQSNRLQSVA